MLRLPVKLLAFIGLMVSFGVAYAGLIGGASYVTNSNGSPTIVVDTVIYTQSFELNRADVFGVFVKAASTGTPALKIELEESYAPPTTEGSGDTNWIEPADVSDVVTSLTDTNAHIYPLSPVPMPYARFKITNSSTIDATLTMYTFLQGNN